MNETVNKSRLAEFREVGYKINIEHQRKWKVAYKDFSTNKILVHKVLNPASIYAELNRDFADNSIIWELLPKGGKTLVTVTDPDTGLEFIGVTRCRDDDNYNKREGIERALNKIVDLMRGYEYQNKEGFKVKVS